MCNVFSKQKWTSTLDFSFSSSEENWVTFEIIYFSSLLNLLQPIKLMSEFQLILHEETKCYCHRIMPALEFYFQLLWPWNRERGLISKSSMYDMLG